MKRDKHFWLFISFLCLAAGAGLYATLRPLAWMPWQALKSNLPLWVHQHLPDGLWAAAFASFLIYIGKERKNAIYAVAWAWFWAVALEGLQLLQLWPGTADWADVVWAGMGCAVIWICTYFISDETS